MQKQINSNRSGQKSYKILFNKLIIGYVDVIENALL